jgi:hypothetical protein
VADLAYQRISPAAQESLPSEQDSSSSSKLSAALLLGLFGWNLQASSKLSAECGLCGRVLHLATSCRTDGLSNSEETHAWSVDINVVQEHRRYCPWVNTAHAGGAVLVLQGTPQVAGRVHEGLHNEGTCDEPGWILCLELLRRQYSHTEGAAASEPNDVSMIQEHLDVRSLRVSFPPCNKLTCSRSRLINAFDGFWILPKDGYSPQQTQAHALEYRN